MVELIAAEGGKTNSAEVTRTLKKHLEHGYVVLGPNGTYQVTDYAAQRFDFSSPKMNEGPASTGPSIVSTGPEAGARGGATHLPPEGSIPSGSTSVKEGQVSTPADLHAHNPKGGLLM